MFRACYASVAAGRSANRARIRSAPARVPSAAYRARKPRRNTSRVFAATWRTTCRRQRPPSLPDHGGRIGKGVEADLDEAKRWFSRAAAKDDAAGISLLEKLDEMIREDIPLSLAFEHAGGGA